MTEPNSATRRLESANKKPLQGKRKSTGSFKSPLLEGAKSRRREDVSTSPEQRLQQLTSQLDEVKKEIAHLHSEGLRGEELEKHIAKLHEYNEIKDVGQLVMGRIAAQEGVCTRDLYERYGLNLED